jgi:hypothetical protein
LNAQGEFEALDLFNVARVNESAKIKPVFADGLY